MSLIGKKAPDFNVPAVLADGSIVDDFSFFSAAKGKYAVLFFYPLDFTFVCPSELIALNNRIEKFKEKNVEVIGVSIDSHFTHNAWRNTDINEGGIGPLQFTLASDMTHSISTSYDVKSDAGVAFRGTFIIDTEGFVRSQIVNDLPLGRNIDEILRIIDALEFHKEHGEVCPAGWQKGNKGMDGSPEGVAKYLKENSKKL